MPTAYKSPDEAKTALTTAFAPTNTEQQNAIANAASLVPKTTPPVTPDTTVTPTSDTTKTTTPSGTTEVKTETTKSPYDQYIDKQATALDDLTTQRQKNADDLFALGKQASETITNIQNGTTPLSAGEQAMLDGLKSQYDQSIKDQITANQNYQTAQEMAIVRNGGQYQPLVWAQRVNTIITQGTQKVTDLQIKEAAAIAELTQNIKDKNIAAVKDSYNIYQDAAKERQSAIKDMISEAQGAIKDAQDAQAKAQKDYYDQVTKPIQDLKLSVAKNGAPTSVLQAMGQAQTIDEALAVGGDWLQTATGDMGDYLNYKRSQQAQGLSFQSYDTWLKAKKASDAADKANEAYATAYASAKGKAAGELAGGGGTVTLKPLTEVQAKDFTYAQRGDLATPIINLYQSNVSSMNGATYAAQKAAFGSDMFNYLVDPTLRNLFQAEKNFALAVLRRESGAAISQTEYDGVDSTYFPRPGDDETTLAQKATLRQTAIDSFKANVPNYQDRIAGTPSAILNSSEDLATQTVADWAAKSPQNKAAYESAKQIFPQATALELKEQLGL